MILRKKDSRLFPYKNGIKNYFQLLFVHTGAPEMVILMMTSVELHQT